MSGIVNEQSQLIVTGSGGGGSNVNITGPLGSKPAASSVSVALASDQIPLSVTVADGNDVTEGAKADAAWSGSGSGSVVSILKAIFAASSSGGLADVQEYGPVTWSSGSPGSPITFTTPANGTLLLFLKGTWSGSILVQEQFSTGGNYTSAQGYYIPTLGLSNSKQSWQTWFNQFGSVATDFIAAVTVKGIGIQLTNNVSTGSVAVTALFKRNDLNVKPIVNVGAVLGFGADVNQFNELNVTRVGNNQQWVLGPNVDGVNPGSQEVPVDAEVPLLFNGTTYDRLRGDLTNGAFVNIKNSVPLSVSGSKTPTDSFANPTDGLDALSFLMGWDATNNVWKRLQVNPGTGLIRTSYDSPFGQTASGTIQLAGSVVSVSCKGASVVLAQITANGALGGTPFATILAQGSTDGGVSWSNLQFNIPTLGNFFSIDHLTNYAVGTTLIVSAGGFTNIQFVLIGVDSDGPITLNVTTSGSNQYLYSTSLASGSIVSIGGVGGVPIATVRLGGDAAQTIDTSLIVGLSPNSPLPAGTNNIGSVNVASLTSSDLTNLYQQTYAQLIPLLADIKTELKILNEITKTGLNIRDEIENLRSDPIFLN